MELRHLRYFVAVAEELHFGRAAARLHMAQPPLSQQIRALEEEIGARLFARSSRSVRLTPAGAAFLPEARGVLERVEAAARLARRVERGEAGELMVGYMNPVMDACLCRALVVFRRERPDVDLRLRELSTPAQLDELRAGRLDIAFIRFVRNVRDLRGLSTRLVAREPYVLALPEGHPLAAREVAPLAEAARLPLILFPRANLPALYDDIVMALRRAAGSEGPDGPELHIAQEVTGKHAALALVAAGLGASLVPASAADWTRRGVVLRPLSPGLPAVEMAAAWRADGLSAAAGELARLTARGLEEEQEAAG